MGTLGGDAVAALVYRSTDICLNTYFPSPSCPKNRPFVAKHVSVHTAGLRKSSRPLGGDKRQARYQRRRFLACVVSLT